MHPNNIQPELFSSPDNQPHQPVDMADVERADVVMQPTLRNLHVELHNIVRPLTDSPLEAMAIDHEPGHSDETATEPESAETSSDNIPRLADPDLDKIWRAQRDIERPTVPTSTLSSAEQNANARRNESDHKARSSRQIMERTE